jgi:hypothetical protein
MNVPRAHSHAFGRALRSAVINALISSIRILSTL